MVNESKRWKADCGLAEEAIIKMTQGERQLDHMQETDGRLTWMGKLSKRNYKLY